MTDDLVSVRYMVDDVEEAIDFYTGHLGFELRQNAAPGRPLPTREGVILLAPLERTRSPANLLIRLANRLPMW